MMDIKTLRMADNASSMSQGDFCSNSSVNCSQPKYVHLDIGIAPSYVAIVSCSFSCLGSVLIILVYLLLKDLRTGAQKIITMLALADLISAVGYIVGSSNFIYHYDVTSGCDTFYKLCRAQAFVTSWSSLVSFSWTVILAFYFFFLIVFKRARVMSRMMLVYSVLAWGAPLLIVVPLLLLDKLGYAHYAASNWCFVKDDPKRPKEEWETVLIVLVAGKLWEILSYMLVTVLYVVITVVIGKTRRRVRNTVLEPRVIHVETRLLAIPIIFILLRIWGTLQFIFSIIVSASDYIDDTNCVSYDINLMYKIFGILQAIGDSGQGWGNAILYIFFSPLMRQRLVEEWCFKCDRTMDDRLSRVAVTQPVDDQSSNYDIGHRKGVDKARRKTNSNDKIMNGVSDGSLSESLPLVKGKALGYKIRKYDTTSSVAYTEGFGSRSSILT